MSGIAGSTANSGNEPSEDELGPADLAGGPPGPSARPGGAIDRSGRLGRLGAARPPTSRREVLRDIGSVLSAAAIMPVMSSADPARRLTDGSAGGDGHGGGIGSMLVPAYFHPVHAPAAWATLTDPRLLAVVLNINDGPGDAREPEFVTAVSAIEAAGGTITGYVDAGFGARSVADMETAARRYRDWYGVADVFLDQVPAGAATLETYRTISGRLRVKGAEFIVFNHGVYPDPGYAAIADLLVTFEGPWPAYQLMDAPPAWATALPAWRFCHLVYGAPTGALDEAVRLAGERGVGVLYVTDGQGVNPWNGLPGYFDREVSLVCGG
ncbi:MAG TPA: spherulation-specific family 4 protein [Streptosporangiaceae bacterium]|nr:spherulation-specific family 4 protein [Streptosporangiaceae bacterium]